MPLSSVLKALIWPALFACSLHAQAGTQKEFSFAGSKVVLLDKAGGAAANMQSDDYTKVLTPFDLKLRLGKEGNVTEKDYLELAAAQTRDWSEEEEQQLQQAFAGIDAFLTANSIKLVLPPVIELIKSDCQEELGAEGYTRANRIMLHPGPQQPLNVHLVAHELFHVYSRFREKERDRIYQLFGFRRCNRIDVAKAMNGRIITNPDCPFIEHYITVNMKKPADVTLLLYSGQDYKQGLGLNDYMKIGLLALEGKGTAKTPEMKGGWGVVYELEAVPDLFRQTGSNTSYVLHPEEIAAEHFAMLIAEEKVTQPEFLQKLKTVLLQ